MVLICWLLLLLTSLQIGESLPQPSEELSSKQRESRNSREIGPGKDNRLLLQPFYSYPERQLSNDDKVTGAVQYDSTHYGPGNNQYIANEANYADMQRDLNIDKAIQEVFYSEKENPTIRYSGDISFPEYKLPSPKVIDLKKDIDNIPRSFQSDENYLKNSILQHRYNPYLNRRPSWQNEVKNPSNNEILQNILDLKDFGLKKISLKKAFLKKAETYSITETDDKNNFLVEKKVNVSKNLKYLNSNNQLANFSDFHSSVLQEMIKNSKKNSFSDHPTKNSLKNHHTAEQYGKKGNVESREHLHFNDFVGGQFIDQEELLAAQYPRIRTQFGEPYENYLKNNPDRETSAQDFVGGQFVGYNNRFLSKSSTPQNTDLYEIGVQPSDFVEGQFFGRPEISKNEILGEPNAEHNAATTMDLSSVANDGIGSTNGVNTERYEHQYDNEMSALSILGSQHNKDDIDKESSDVTKQEMLADHLNTKKSKQQDEIPILMGGIPKFNKGISQTSSIVQQIIDEPGYNDQTEINNLEAVNSEQYIPQDLHSYDLKSYSYSTTIDSLNPNSSDSEMTTTEKNTLNSKESLAYEDYGEDDNLGSIIIDDGNNAKEQSDEIQGQPSQISSNFMETTKEAIGVVPLSGISSEKDYYNTFQETSTQIIKDVYLYDGKDYENGSLDKRPELDEITSSSNKDNAMTEEATKENYLTEICFPLKNKRDISLWDILSGNFYLENNGKKVALSLVKNPMKNCTSGTTSCRLYLDVKNISQVLQDAHENDEDNLVPRNKRQSKSNIFSQLEENKSTWIQNEPPFKYTNGHLNLFPSNSNNSLPPPPPQQTGTTDTIERLINHDESKQEPHKEYTQPLLFPMNEVTSHKSRTKRSTTDSDSCSCSSLFKSTQIPSYKYFVDKRFDILTNIVVAAKHFKDSR